MAASQRQREVRTAYDTRRFLHALWDFEDSFGTDPPMTSSRGEEYPDYFAVCGTPVGSEVELPVPGTGDWQASPTLAKAFGLPSDFFSLFPVRSFGGKKQPARARAEIHTPVLPVVDQPQMEFAMVAGSKRRVRLPTRTEPESGIEEASAQDESEAELLFALEVQSLGQQALEAIAADQPALACDNCRANAVPLRWHSGALRCPHHARTPLPG